MSKTKPIKYSALTGQRVILRAWLCVMFAGLIIFCGLLVLSYFVLDAPAVVNDGARYKRWEGAIGIGELSVIALAVLALFRYKAISKEQHRRVFSQFVSDNGWAVQRQFDTDLIASILLGVGESYEQVYGFKGSYNAQAFNCLIYEYINQKSEVKRYICLSFTLPKSYPMMIIDNRLNDHRYWRKGSNLPDRIPHGVRIDLEGDFGNYFRISATKDAEQETLEVLSPDFMTALLDVAMDKVDVEISNRNLFLIYEADNYTERNLTSLFTTADVVLAKLHRLSRTWMASSKDEEKAVALAAVETRHKLIFRSDIVGVVVLLVIFVVFAVLIVSRVQDEPTCTITTPCYRTGK